MNVIEYTLPTWCASYLINGDASGLEDEEIAMIDRFVESQGVHFVGMGEDTWFSSRNDLGSKACDVSTFTAYENPDKVEHPAFEQYLETALWSSRDIAPAGHPDYSEGEDISLDDWPEKINELKLKAKWLVKFSDCKSGDARHTAKLAGLTGV